MVFLSDLNENFGMPGTLTFEDHDGLIRARVSTPVCAADIYLHGAHLTHWQPVGAEPVLYLSPNSFFTPQKAIRGGVPVIFPWFGARTPEVTGGTTEGGQHGFARTSEWQVVFAALAGPSLHLTLTLGPNDASRAAGFDHFRLALEFVFGATLTMRLTVANEGADDLVFEEALHTYFHVGDAEQVRVLGLADTEFLDKTDSFQRKRQTQTALTLRGETDRPYLNTPAMVTLEDPVLQRRIVVAKSGSQTTVVWNPWSELAASLPDLGAGEWKRFTCVETANAAENRITLAPRTAHTMEARISLEQL